MDLSPQLIILRTVQFVFVKKTTDTSIPINNFFILLLFQLFCISLNYLIVLAQYMPSSLLEYLEISCSVATRSGFAPMPMLQNVVCKKNRLSNTTVFYKKTAITYMYPLHMHWFWRVTWFIPKRDIAFFIVSFIDRGDHFTWQNIYLFICIFNLTICTKYV